jgi:hypothetical protein
VSQHLDRTTSQVPATRTQRADFPHFAHQCASHQGLCDLSCWDDFQLWPTNPIPVNSFKVSYMCTCANYTPKLKKRSALLPKLKGVFRRYRSQPVDRVVYLINLVLRGWVNYFAVGNFGECFSFKTGWKRRFGAIW